ncbi:MAG: NAD-dependent DNA ligase LigA, partial [Oscillospiraceae bacterium]|nr:NAD-dependent DNA ligase LigA [Oscillospiraceae bacterium]
MELKAAQEKLNSLKQLVEYHSDLYYNQNRNEISDYEYDMLMQQIKNIEAQFPQLITEDSPTQKVQGLANSTFEKVTH